MAKKKKAMLTNRERRELLPELMSTLAIHHTVMVASGLNDGRFRTRRGGPDKRGKIQDKNHRREMHG